MIQRNPFDS
jgi:acetoin utilization protein AcuB